MPTIAKQLNVQKKKGLFGFSWQPDQSVKDFINPAFSTWLLPDMWKSKASDYVYIISADKVGNLSSPSLLVQVINTPVEIDLFWTDMKSSDGFDVTLRMTLTFRVNNFQRFIESFAPQLRTCDSFDSNTIQSLWNSTFETYIREEVQQRTFEHVQQELSDAFWNAETNSFALWIQLPPAAAIANSGIDFNRVLSYAFSSSEAKELAEKRQRQQIREKELEEKKNQLQFDQRNQELEIQRQELEAQRIQKEKEILQNTNIIYQQKQMEIATIKMASEHEIRALEEKYRIESLSSEKKILELQREIAEIHLSIAQTNGQQKKQAECQEQLVVIDADIDYNKQLQGCWPGITQTNKELLHKTVSSFKRRVSEFPPNTQMMMTMPAVKTRDLGARINTCQQDSLIMLRMTSPINGYLTVFNVGTSGNVYSLLPNWVIQPGNMNSLRVEQNQVYTFPQSFSCGEFYEMDCEGMECIFALVTPEPLNIPLKGSRENIVFPVDLDCFKRLIDQFFSYPEEMRTGFSLEFMVTPKRQQYV